jgi:hypothetical protein
VYQVGRDVLLCTDRRRAHILFPATNPSKHPLLPTPALYPITPSDTFPLTHSVSFPLLGLSSPPSFPSPIPLQTHVRAHTRPFQAPPPTFSPTPPHTLSLVPSGPPLPPPPAPLQTHVRAHTRPFECPLPECRRRFGWSVDLKRHIEKIHHRHFSEFPGCTTVTPPSKVDYAAAMGSRVSGEDSAGGTSRPRS